MLLLDALIIAVKFKYLKNIKRIKKMIKLYNDCCFKVFPFIKEKIDLVIVDLPYGATDMKWDIPIDLDKMWVSLKKIIKKKLSYYFFLFFKIWKYNN